MFMTIETKDDEGKIGTKEEYHFIQEEISRKKRDKWLRLIVKTMIAAVLFGVLGGMIFAWSGSFFLGVFQNDIDGKTISFTTEEPKETEKPKVTEKVKEKENEKAEAPKKQDKTALTMANYAEAFSGMSLLADNINQSIVTVSGLTEAQDFFENPVESEHATCGVIIANNEKDILILTNYAKIKNAKQLRVTFQQNKSVKAQLYGSDSEMGLAVVGVSLNKIPQEIRGKMKVAKLGDSYNVSAGTVAMALGSPNGHMYSMDIGFISGNCQDKYIADYKLELYNTSMQNYEKGEGIIVNLSGEIIGVITHNFAEENNKTLHTFLGISRLKSVIEKMVNKQEQVYVGIIGNDITSEYASTFGVPSGVYVTEVVTDSPAYNAELKPGHLITEINGETVTSMIGYYNILSECEVEDEVKITVIDTTAGKPKPRKITVTVEERK